MTAGRARLPLAGHGDVSAAPYRGGWRARVRYRGVDGRVSVVSATGRSERAARRALSERIAAVAREGGRVERAEHPMTVSRAAREWYDQQAEDGRLRPQSLEQYLWMIRAEIVPRLGGVDLRELTVKRIEDEVRSLIAAGQRGKAEKFRGLLVQIINRAERLDLVRGNPAVRTTPVRRATPVPKALTLDEIAAIRDAVRTWRADDGTRIGKRPTGILPVCIDLMLGTGLRIGEAMALTWRNLDLEADPPTVEVEATLVELKAHFEKVPLDVAAVGDDGREAMRWSPNPKHKKRWIRDAHGLYVKKGGGLVRQDKPKSASGERIIVLPSFAATALRGFRPADWTPDAPVFVTSTGNHTSPNNFRKALRPALQAAGIDPSSFHPHLLRSTVATAIARAGEHGVEDAAAVLGHHASLVTTRHYVERSRVTPDVTDVLEPLVREQASQPDPDAAGSRGEGLWNQPTFGELF